MTDEDGIDAVRYIGYRDMTPRKVSAMTHIKHGLPQHLVVGYLYVDKAILSQPYNERTSDQAYIVEDGDLNIWTIQEDTIVHIDCSRSSRVPRCNDSCGGKEV